MSYAQPKAWSLPPISTSDQTAAQHHQNALTKPQGALGQLEHLATWLAGIQHSPRPKARPAHALLFAADHPVAELGVSAFPQSVTAAMVNNLSSGGAAASVMCQQLQVPLTICDVGVNKPYIQPTSTAANTQFLQYSVRGEVGNLRDQSALDAEAFLAAWEAGVAAVKALPNTTRVLILGEMGIANSTPASALYSWLLNQEPNRITGPGTGISGQQLTDKRQIVAAAIGRHQNSTADPDNPYHTLQSLGGREIVAMVSAMGQAASQGIALLIDGFIVSAAALVAIRIHPDIEAFMQFSHASAEPGHALVLKALGTRTLLNCDMRLGEGTGALATLPLLDLAIACHLNMATFEQAHVPNVD